MSWLEIKQTSDKTVFTDCMLCGDTKSIIMDLNNTIASGNTYEQYGDGYDKFGNSKSKYYISSYNGNDNTNRITYYESGDTFWWWLRSPILTNTYIVHCIDKNGNCNGSWTTRGNATGLAFGFCIR